MIIQYWKKNDFLLFPWLKITMFVQTMLYAAVEQAPSTEVTEEEVIKRYYARFDEQFFRVCDKELAKINTFFSGKERC